MRAVLRIVVGLAVIGAVVAAAVAAPGPATGESSAAPGNPLAPFERMIGGQWHIPTTYQTVEWGVDKKSVVARAYLTTDRGDKLVSEGMWYWHPGEKAIKGHFVAVGMGIDLFEYTTRFEGDRMINYLVTYGSDGARHEYEETWDFRGDDEIVWTLWSQTPDGPRKEMGDTYKRK
jgi:hypothetical protein